MKRTLSLFARTTSVTEEGEPRLRARRGRENLGAKKNMSSGGLDDANIEVTSDSVPSYLDSTSIVVWPGPAPKDVVMSRFRVMFLTTGLLLLTATVALNGWAQ